MELQKLLSKVIFKIRFLQYYNNLLNHAFDSDRISQTFYTICEVDPTWQLLLKLK